MAAWLFTAAGWTLVLVGVLIAWRFGWRDPGKGKRRCPRCWYDMTATAGLRCSECGHEARREAALFRRQRRWRWLAVAFLMLLVAHPISRWPDMQRDGPIGALPRTAVLLWWPTLTRDALLKKGWSRFFEQSAVFKRIEAEQAVTPWWWEKPIIRRTSIALLTSPRNSFSERFAVKWLMLLGDDMGDGAGVLVDRFLNDGRRQGSMAGSNSIFFWLPQRGRPFVPRMIEEIRQKPELLARDPMLVFWLAERHGSVAEIIPSIRDLPLAASKQPILFRMPFWAATRFQASEIPALSQAISLQGGGFVKAEPDLLRRPLPDATLLVEDFVALLKETPTQTPTKTLLTLCCSGLGMGELAPLIEPWTRQGEEADRAVARIALAVVTRQPQDVEPLVRTLLQEPFGSTPSSPIALQAAANSTMSGLWPPDVVSDWVAPHLSTGTGVLGASELRAMESLLSSAVTARKHRDVIIEQISSRPMMATRICQHIENFPEAAHELIPILSASAARTTGSHHTMIRQALAEANRMAAANAASRHGRSP